MKHQQADPLIDDGAQRFDFSGDHNPPQGDPDVKCPKCKAPVPQGDLVCKPCLERKSRDAYIEHQRQFMPKVFAGDLTLRCRHGRAPGTLQEPKQMHIELFGDPAHCYCGVPTLGMKPSFLLFRGELRAPLNTCVACAQLFERLLNEELDAIPVDTSETPEAG